MAKQVNKRISYRNTDSRSVYSPKWAAWVATVTKLWGQVTPDDLKSEEKRHRLEFLQEDIAKEGTILGFIGESAGLLEQMKGGPLEEMYSQIPELPGLHRTQVAGVLDELLPYVDVDELPKFYESYRETHPQVKPMAALDVAATLLAAGLPASTPTPNPYFYFVPPDQIERFWLYQAGFLPTEVNRLDPRIRKLLATNLDLAAALRSNKSALARVEREIARIGAEPPARQRAHIKRFLMQTDTSVADDKARRRGEEAAILAAGQRGLTDKKYLTSDAYKVGKKTAKLIDQTKEYILKRMYADPTLHVVIHGRDAEVLYETLRRDADRLSDSQWKQIHYVISSGSLTKDDFDVRDALKDFQRENGKAFVETTPQEAKAGLAKLDVSPAIRKYLYYLKVSSPPGALHIDTGWKGTIPDWFNTNINPVGDIKLMSSDIQDRQIPLRGKLKSEHRRVAELTEDSEQRLRGPGSSSPQSFDTEGMTLWDPKAFWSRVYGIVDALKIPRAARRNGVEMRHLESDIKLLITRILKKAERLNRDLQPGEGYTETEELDGVAYDLQQGLKKKDYKGLARTLEQALPILNSYGVSIPDPTRARGNAGRTHRNSPALNILLPKWGSPVDQRRAEAALRAIIKTKQAETGRLILSDDGIYVQLSGITPYWDTQFVTLLFQQPLARANRKPRRR